MPTAPNGQPAPAGRSGTHPPAPATARPSRTASAVPRCRRPGQSTEPPPGIRVVVMVDILNSRQECGYPLNRRAVVVMPVHIVTEMVGNLRERDTLFAALRAETLDVVAHGVL